MIQLHIYQGKLVKYLNVFRQQISKKKTNLIVHSQAIVNYLQIIKDNYWILKDLVMLFKH
jgi:hypothetical protein